jgi:hypothetical protein
MTNTLKKAETLTAPRPKLAAACRVFFILTCVGFFLFALSGTHPPASAQQPYTYYQAPPPATLGGLQVEAATQQVTIYNLVKTQADEKADLEIYKKETSKRLSEMETDIKANTDAASTMKGMMQAGGALLVALQIGSMVWGRRKAA